MLYQAQNEQQLRVMTNDLSEMKKTKVRLMKQMKDEMSKNKQQEARRNKEIAQLRRESRQRELAIRNLQSEKRQREAVLRRKQEEVLHVVQLVSNFHVDKAEYDGAKSAIPRPQCRPVGERPA